MKKHFIRCGYALLIFLVALASCEDKPTIDYSKIVGKVWFTRTYERWNTDYYDQYIPESYRSWTYDIDPGCENWFWYFFEDDVCYQIHTKDYDTVYYPFEFKYYPNGDSIYINFITVDTTLEDYHATIQQLDDNYFIFSDEYRPHQFEKITMTNVTGDTRSEFKLNPKKVKNKAGGPLIPITE